MSRTCHGNDRAIAQASGASPDFGSQINRVID
jgi:hypothetical protein